MFTLTIKTSNAAFYDSDEAETHDGAALLEIARILREVAEHMTLGSWDGKCLDANGNTVGRYDYREGD